MPLSLRRLKVLTTIAKHQSVTRAANTLFMTPPAVTKGLRELEIHLQTDLFDRTSKGMVLTEAGEVFLSHAKRALNEIERGEREVERLISGEGGKVWVGATVEAGVLVLPRAIGKLVEQHPQMDVQLRGGDYESLSQAVRTGTLDFFLGMEPDIDAARDLEFTPMYQDQLHLLVRRDHPLLEKTDATLADTLDFRWLLTAGEGRPFELLKANFKEANLEFPSNPMIVDSISFFRGTAKTTDAIAVVSGARLLAEFEMNQLKKLSIPLTKTQHNVGIVERNDPYRSSFSKELIKLIVSCAKELGLAVREYHD